MGLPEKRALKEFQDKHLPGITKDLEKVAGKSVPMTIHWDSLAWEGSADLYNNVWTNGCFLPLIEALRNVCSDEIGKEAVNKSLKKIDVKGDYAHAMRVSFDDGVLSLDFAFSVEIEGKGSDNFKKITQQIQQVLEQAL